MHEQFPGLRKSVCGDTLRSDWPEGLLAHHPDSEGKGGCCDLLLFGFKMSVSVSIMCILISG